LRRDRERDSPKKLRRDRERDEKRLPDFSSADLSGRDSRYRNSAREVDQTRDIKSTEAKRSTHGLKDSSETKNNSCPDENRLRPDPREFARSKIYLQVSNLLLLCNLLELLEIVLLSVVIFWH
jgi:hypothetical protein